MLLGNFNLFSKSFWFFVERDNVVSREAFVSDVPDVPLVLVFLEEIVHLFQTSTGLSEKG